MTKVSPYCLSLSILPFGGLEVDVDDNSEEDQSKFRGLEIQIDNRPLSPDSLEGDVATGPQRTPLRSQWCVCSYKIYLLIMVLSALLCGGGVG